MCVCVQLAVLLLLLLIVGVRVCVCACDLTTFEPAVGELPETSPSPLAAYATRLIKQCN